MAEKAARAALRLNARFPAWKLAKSSSQQPRLGMRHVKALEISHIEERKERTLPSCSFASFGVFFKVFQGTSHDASGEVSQFPHRFRMQQRECTEGKT
ncbi:MAG: hypothetical protein IJ173_02835 [Kiritimatiellae bacterium]|nr:hypothetical protein [Kiritimatiellia bacterium]